MASQCFTLSRPPQTLRSEIARGSCSASVGRDLMEIGREGEPGASTLSSKDFTNRLWVFLLYLPPGQVLVCIRQWSECHLSKLHIQPISRCGCKLFAICLLHLDADCRLQSHLSASNRWQIVDTISNSLAQDLSTATVNCSHNTITCSGRQRSYEKCLQSPVHASLLCPDSDPILHESEDE